MRLDFKWGLIHSGQPLTWYLTTQICFPRGRVPSVVLSIFPKGLIALSVFFNTKNTGQNTVFQEHFKKDFSYLFLERGEEKGKEIKRNIDCLPLIHAQQGTKPTT